jgi:hypothetical protein
MTATVPGQTQNATTIKNEAKKYAAFNSPDLTILDSDIVLCRYTPYYAAGSRLSYDLTTKPANAVRVTMRRDGTANNPLSLFFAPVIGTRPVELSATAFAYIMPAAGVMPGAPLLPYAVQANYYYEAMGQTILTGVDGKKIDTAKVGGSSVVTDGYTVNPTTLQVTAGPDGVNEILLFGDKMNSGVSQAPGNWGSINLGADVNAAGTLQRQILYGPTTSDFTSPDFVTRVNPLDGGLYVPFSAYGDPGVTTSTKSTLESITGQPRIVPLYDTKTGTGSTAVYSVVAYAGVVITSVNFTGNPKSLYVQPAFLASNKVTPVTSDAQAATTYGVYTPPKLVIP